MADFLKGIGFPLQGFRLLTSPGIRLFIVIPLLVNALLFLLVIVFGVRQIQVLNDWISSRWGWAEWAQWVLWPLFILVTVTIVFFSFTLLANLIAAPFNGMLSEAVARRLGGPATTNPAAVPGLSTLIGTALKNEIGKLLYFLAWAVPLLVLFMVPVLNVIAPLAWLLFSAWLISLEYLDYPMSARGMGFRQIRARMRQSRSLCIGFGIGALVIMMIPLINFMAMPVTVIAATRLWIEELEKSGNITA